MARGAGTKKVGDETFDAYDFDFGKNMDTLGEGLAEAGRLADDEAGERPVAAADGNMAEWKKRHASAREQDESGNYQQALDLVIGGKGATVECFDGVDTSLAAAIEHEEREFEQAAGDGLDAMGYLPQGAGVPGRDRRGRRAAGHRPQALGVPVKRGAGPGGRAGRGTRVEGGARMRARRLRAGLRGWGGVGAMAFACSLAVLFALLLPVVRSHGETGGSGTGTAGHGVAHGSQARGRGVHGPGEADAVPGRRRRPHHRRDPEPRGREAQADRRRRPEQLPLGLPRPEQRRGRRAGGL